MDNDPKERKEDSDVLNSECDGTETEPDRDSVWSSSSVCGSEATTDNSSIASPFRDLPTVRASKEKGDDEIQKLILAAEALVMERARLNIPTTTMTPKGSVVAGEIGATTHTAMVHHKEAFPDNRCSAGNSGYYTDVEEAGLASHTYSTLSGEKSINLNFYCDTDPLSVGSRETLSTTPCDSLLISKASDSSFKGCDPQLTPITMLSDNPTSTVPRLSLEPPTRGPESGRAAGVSEEKMSFNKVEKEACNSSIRGSSSGGAGVSHQARPAGGSQSPAPLQTRTANETVSAMVQEEGSCLLTLALSATTSLKRLTRLLRQVGALQLGPDTPRVCESVLQELTHHEAHHQALETKLSAAAANLQTAVTQVRMMEGECEEHHHHTHLTHTAALALLHQVEAALQSCGLKHMLAVTSPRRRCSSRVLEDVGSALTLLTGELTRRMQHLTRAEEEAAHLREELQGVREVMTQRDSSARVCEAQARQVKQQSQEDLTSLRQCLSQAENNLTEAQLENARLSEEVKRQASDSSVALAAVQKKLCDTQHKAETRVSELERQVDFSSKEKQCLEASVGELKEHLTLRTQQVHLVEEESNQLVESLRSALRHQQAEVEQLRRHLESANTEKTRLTHSNNELQQEATAREEELHEVKGKCEQMNRRVTDLEEEHGKTQTDQQQKIDRLSSERGDLQAKGRAQEFAILQLRTELEMEKVQTRALNEETAVLGKKARDLQERLWTQAKRWRMSGVTSNDTVDYHQQGVGLTSKCESCTNLGHTDDATPLTSHKQQVGREEEDSGSLAREERLHTLLREKDVELESLHHSLSTQITTKNQELEVLTNKLGSLEEQLCTLVTGLEASAAMGNITTEVGQLLQERTNHLDNLQESSKWLQDELSSLALENQSLNKELVVSRRMEKDSLYDAQESAREARQEAREERMATARLKEECSRLQAQLGQTQHTLQQERQERKINAVVNGVKHREFSSLLESATTALNRHQT